LFPNKLAIALLAVSCSAWGVEPEAARQKELVHLVRQDCGSCHGMTLKGGLGPALLPENLRDKPAEGLTATIYYGRPERPCRRGSSSCRKPKPHGLSIN